MTFLIRVRESGDVLEKEATIEDARYTLSRFEAADREDGVYSPNFYEIYDTETEEAY